MDIPEFANPRSKYSLIPISRSAPKSIQNKSSILERVVAINCEVNPRASQRHVRSPRMFVHSGIRGTMMVWPRRSWIEMDSLPARELRGPIKKWRRERAAVKGRVATPAHSVISPSPSVVWARTPISRRPDKTASGISVPCSTFTKRTEVTGWNVKARRRRCG